MKFIQRLILIGSFISLLTTMAWAKKFTSQYCEFELPPKWVCSLEGSEYVCQSINKERQREAIIILAAKKAGSQDNLTNYNDYLKKPKTFNLPGGKTQVSEAKVTKMHTISGHQWVDSLHLASEVPGFYTRYLATIKADLGIAVTMSVAKGQYNNYKELFDRLVKSLKVFRANVNIAGTYKVKGKDKDLFNTDNQYIPADDSQHNINVSQSGNSGDGSSGDSSELIFLLIIIVAGALVFLKMKKRNKK